MAETLVLQYLLLFTLLINFHFSFGQAWEDNFRRSCPSKEDINGCSCKYYTNDQKELKCQYDHTVEEYVTGIKNVGFSENDKLAIVFASLRKIPNDISSDSFKGLNVADLIFNHCKITKWTDEPQGPAFVGLEDTLESLSISESIFDESPNAKIEDVEKTEFSLGHLRKLKKIDFDGNSLGSFCSGWFEGNLESSIESVKLRNNKIRYICENAFANLKKLKYISLEDNKLLEVSRNMFPNPALYLKDMDLSFNDIKDPLPEDLFENMPALKEVMFGRNYNLTLLEKKTWSPVWSQLFYVDFHGVNCKEEIIGWMFEVKRPAFLYATCLHSWKGKSLRTLIDEKQDAI